MKIIGTASLALSAALAACSGEASSPPERSITVCMDQTTHDSVNGARMLATQMFADIKLTIHWRCGAAARTEAGGPIAIHLSSDVTRNDRHAALAYALPFQGKEIVIFFDRVYERASGERGRISRLLAYVLVHEITHMMQGLAQHSASGIMKAAWTSSDEHEIQTGSLAFLQTDIELIYYGLDRRKTLQTAATIPPR